MKIKKQSRPVHVTLKTVAERVGLAPCSVSAVLNDTPAARAIPMRTKIRVLEAVRELNYRPNLAARSLRTRRTYTIAALVSDVGNPYVAAVVAGAEKVLRRKGYALLIAGCELDAESLELQEVRLRQRCVEGVITVDALLPRDLWLPSHAIELSDHARPESSWDDLRRELVVAGEVGARQLLQKVEQNSIHTKREMEKWQLDQLIAADMEIVKAPIGAHFQFAD